MQGASFTGFRLGLQYQPIDELKFGVVFRNKVVVTTHADSAKVLTADATDAELEFTLPAKLGFGVRTDLGRLGLATDVEYAFQSQNQRPPLSGTLMGADAEVPNVFDWKDGVTLRFGAEYRVGPDRSFPTARRLHPRQPSRRTPRTRAPSARRPHRPAPSPQAPASFKRRGK